MKLSTELFEQVSSALSANGPASNNGEIPPLKIDQRQSARRRSAGAEVTLIPLTAVPGHSVPMPSAVEIRDISLGGVGFVHAGKVVLDQEIVLLLPTGEDGPVAVMGKVAYWQPMRDNLFGVGMQFTRVLRQGGEQPAEATTPSRPYRVAS